MTEPLAPPAWTSWSCYGVHQPTGRSRGVTWTRGRLLAVSSVGNIAGVPHHVVAFRHRMKSSKTAPTDDEIARGMRDFGIAKAREMKVETDNIRKFVLEVARD